MTALALLAAARARGVDLTPAGDRIRLDGPAAARDELRPLVVACKPELLSLLREARSAEVGQAFADAFVRLSARYDGDLVGRLWPAVCEGCPTLARQIDSAERALDAEALAFVNGDAPTPDQFGACQAWFERLWSEAIKAVTEEDKP